MWHEFTITLPDELKEPVTGVLFGLGCVGITEGDAGLTAYFPGQEEPEKIKEALAATFKGLSVSYKAMEEQDWYASWKEKFSPFHAAGLLICPPWRLDECMPEAGEKILILDPGYAFGTGDHVTTMTVLGMLREWAGSHPDLTGKRFLDLGTGTGILSVAAYLYGIRDITAVDVEEAAVETSARNFTLNGIGDKARLVKGSIGEAGLGYDLIAANIFQEALLELMPDTAGALNPGGRLIVSGLLVGQEQAVITKANEAGLTLLDSSTSEGWVTASFLV
jgi:ribosomal protein L11 methyltransferase